MDRAGDEGMVVAGMAGEQSPLPGGPVEPGLGLGEVVIRVDDPGAADAKALLETHLAFSHAVTPGEYAFALDVERLSEPAVTFFSARADGILLGVGALKRLDDSHAELKSMHTREAARGRGVGRAMVEHILAFARQQGYGRVSLETGTMDAFAPARALYSQVGFEPCAPFGEYTPSPYNSWMTMDLTSPAPPAPVDRETGIATYLKGAAALTAVGAQLRPDDWHHPSGCAGWDAAALAGHVLCVVRWHHEWLDRASAGETSPPWPAEELSARNQAALDELGTGDGPARLEAFRAEALRYADRLDSSWSLPYWYPGGLVTAGLHALLAAGEWHLHAWDLGRAIGLDHRPDAAPVRAAWLRLGRPMTADGNAWRALLRASGRA